MLLPERPAFEQLKNAPEAFWKTPQAKKLWKELGEERFFQSEELLDAYANWEPASPRDVVQAHRLVCTENDLALFEKCRLVKGPPVVEQVSVAFSTPVFNEVVDGCKRFVVRCRVYPSGKPTYDREIFIGLDSRGRALEPEYDCLVPDEVRRAVSGYDDAREFALKMIGNNDVVW